MIYNIGITDVDYPVNKCPFYTKWTDMLKRCYSQKYLKKQPTYLGCSVCEEWKYLSNFKRWMETQDWKEKHLDKDILFLNNKIYSPETCIFISPSLNSFMTNSSLKNTSGFNGVVLEKRTLKWVSKIWKESRGYNIGTYHSKEEAYYYYKVERNKELLKWIEKMEDIKIKKALKKHLYILNEDINKFKGPITHSTIHSKKCSVNGLIYNSLKECSKLIDVKPTTIGYRLNSSSFPDWIYVK